MAPTACVTMAAPVMLRPTASRPRSFTLSARPVRGALAPAARLRFTPMRAPALRISASVSHPNQEGEDLGESFSTSMRVPSTGMANIGTPPPARRPPAPRELTPPYARTPPRERVDARAREGPRSEARDPGELRAAQRDLPGEFRAAQRDLPLAFFL